MTGVEFDAAVECDRHRALRHRKALDIERAAGGPPRFEPAWKEAEINLVRVIQFAGETQPRQIDRAGQQGQIRRIDLRRIDRDIGARCIEPTRRGVEL